MARKKSIFAGGKRSVSARMARNESHAIEPIIENSKEALKARDASRKALPVPDLKGSISTIDRRLPTTYEYDLTDLVKKHRHHERLITQLLAGMLLVVSGYGRHTIDTCEKCILEFIAFLNDPKNLSNVKVRVVSEINVTVCQAYKNFLISCFPGRTVNQSRFSLLRRIVHRLQEDFSHDPGIGPVLQWPVGLSGTSKPRQGYTSAAMGELVEACQRDIKETIELHALHAAAAKGGETIRCTEWDLPNLMFYLKERLANSQQRTIEAFIRRAIGTSNDARKFLDNNGYSVEEIIDLYKLRGEDLAKGGRLPDRKLASWTLENFMHRIHYKWSHNSGTMKPIKATIKAILKKSSGAAEFLRENNYSEDQIVEIYLTRGEELAVTGRSPFGHSFHGAGTGKGEERNFKLILCTLAQKFPDYPFNLSLERATWFLGYKRYTEMDPKEIDTTVEGTMLSAVNRIGTTHYRRSIKGVNLIRASMHFLLETLYPFVLHVQINTGWNLECLVALTDDVESYVTPCLLDPDNYVLIQSTKVRGQKREPKTVIHRCSRHQQFSTYRLLKYVESVVTRYKDCPSYRPGRLWQYAVRSSSQMTQLITSYGGNTADKHYGSKLFISRHSFKHFTDAWVSHGRIRTSYETLREMQGIPSQVISQDMGHESEETTSKHYAADVTSNAVKDVKIAAYQEQLVHQLRHYDCQLAESESLSKLREAIEKSHGDAGLKARLKEAARTLNTDEKTIVHLISPEGQTYIAACRDSLNPTWAGHEQYLKKGERCYLFNKCGGCRQAVIFREALPFIACRLLDLEKSRPKTNQFEWLSNFGEESDQWQGVLSDWSDQGAVEKAREAAQRGDVALPLRMRGPR